MKECRNKTEKLRGLMESLLLQCPVRGRRVEKYSEWSLQIKWSRQRLRGSKASGRNWYTVAWAMARVSHGPGGHATGKFQSAVRLQAICKSAFVC